MNVLDSINKHTSEISTTLAKGVNVTSGINVSSTETNSADILTEVQKISNTVNVDNAIITQLYIIKDGVLTPVQLDSTAPYTNNPIPVVLTNIDGSVAVNVDLTNATLSVDSIIKDKDGNSFSSTSLGVGQRSLDVSIKPANLISTGNTSTTILTANSTFTGVWVDVLEYTEIIVSVNTNQNSATDGLKIEWSADGITKHEDDVFTITANVGKTFSFPVNRRYMRVVYVNGTTSQTYFNLETILKQFSSKGSSHRLKDNLSQEDDAIVTKTQIVGFSTGGGGSLVNVKANPSGALTVESTESITQRTPSKSTVTSSGSVTAGAQSITFITSTDFIGTILGDTAKASSTYTYSVNCNDTLAAIVYTCTAGSIEILKIV